MVVAVAAKYGKTQTGRDKRPVLALQGCKTRFMDDMLQSHRMYRLLVPLEHMYSHASELLTTAE